MKVLPLSPLHTTLQVTFVREHHSRVASAPRSQGSMSERPAKRAKISDDESQTLQFIEKTVKKVAPWVKDQKLEASADDFAVYVDI